MHENEGKRISARVAFEMMGRRLRKIIGRGTAFGKDGRLFGFEKEVGVPLEEETDKRAKSSNDLRVN